MNMPAYIIRASYVDQLTRNALRVCFERMQQGEDDRRAKTQSHTRNDQPPGGTRKANRLGVGGLWISTYRSEIL